MHRGDLTAAAAGATVGGAVFLLAHQALGDDAHIGMTYARELALHGHWGLIPGETANSATSPLNVWLIAAGTLVTRQPAVGVGLVLVASLAAAGWWSSQLARNLGLSPLLPLAAVALLGTSPLLVSTVGLETYLGIALLIGLVRYSAVGRWGASGVLAGLLVLTRPDFAVLVAVVALVFLRHRLMRTAAVAVAVAAPWHVTSWMALGSAVPDTFVFKTAKADRDRWNGATLATPDMYVGLFPTAPLVVAVLPAALGVLSVAAWPLLEQPARRVAATFAAAGVAHWAVLSALGVPPYLWYYGPLLAGLALSAAVTLAALPRTQLAAGALTGATVGAATVLLLSGPLPWREPPLIGNYATAQEGAAIGRAVSRIVPPGEAISSPGEIGTLAFHCRCRIVDRFSHRGVAAGRIEHRIERAGPVMAQLLAWNYLHLPPLEPPPQPQWLLRFRHDPSARTGDDVRRWPATMSWHPPAQAVLIHR